MIEKDMDVFPAPLSQQTSAVGRNARSRKIARSLAIGCLSVATLVCAIGYLMGSASGFTIQIDQSAAFRKDLVLHSGQAISQIGEDGVSYLSAEGVENAKPTTARKVFAFLDQLLEEGEANGTSVFSEVQGIQHALAYTFSLSNISDASVKLAFSVRVDSYLPPRNPEANNPFSYLRLITCVNHESQQHCSTHIYASPNDEGIGTSDGGSADLRECISEYREVKLPDGEILREPSFFVENNGFCENFLQKGDELMRESHIISAKETMRFTIATYFEGLDPDCAKSAPLGCRLSLSACIGE